MREMSSPAPRATDPGRRLQLDERRDQLLAVGQRLFADRPYDEISIDDIAAAAGVSKGLLYHYFPTKRDFYLATIRFIAAELEVSFDARLDLPLKERLRMNVRRYFDYVEGHSAGYASLIRGGVGTDPEVRAIVEGVRASAMEQVSRALGIQGEPSPLVVYAIRGWFGTLEQTSLDWITGRKIEWHELLVMLEQSLGAALLIAARIDPDCGVDPQAIVRELD